MAVPHPLDLAQQTTTLIIRNKELEDIIKIVKSLEDFGSLIKRCYSDNQK